MDQQQAHSDIENLQRIRRIHKSHLLKLKLDGIKTPSILIANNLDTYKKSFKIVHDEYVNCKYIQPNHHHPYHYSLFSFLPETRVFSFMSSQEVVATLTEIRDSRDYGLPMDELYIREIDGLRQQGRTVAEISSFVTTKTFRMKNIMVYLTNAMFKYSQATKIDDICIMVNPKHVAFYTKLFLFKPFGPVRFYDKVQAPAVPLRIDMLKIVKELQETYSGNANEDNLYTFFCKSNPNMEMLLAGSNFHQPHHTPQQVIDFFCHPNALATAA